MNFEEYIVYHLRGDAGVEERFVATFVNAFGLSEWDAFRLMYYYALTYSIPSAIRLLKNPGTPRESLYFRTDRRYVRICGRYEKCMANLNKGKMTDLFRCQTTADQYAVVSNWYYFGRYAAYLFLECFYKYRPCEIDNLKMKYIPKENYTKGAVIVSGCKNAIELNKFVEAVKNRTNDNVFSIETSLCAVEKIKKGTRWDGYYTERFVKELTENDMERYLGLVA